MAVDQDTLHMLRSEPEAPELDLSWLEPGTEWGVRATAGRRGLTLDEINIGSYGDAPAWRGGPRSGAACRLLPQGQSRFLGAECIAPL